MLRASTLGAGVVVTGAIVAACSTDEMTPRASADDPSEFVLSDDSVLLDAAGIREAAIGNTLVGTVRDGERYELYLRADGAAILRMEGGRTETGRWELHDTGEIVSQWPTIADGDRLVSRYYFDRESGRYSNLATNSLRWSTFRIEQGDSRGLDG